MLSPDIVCPVTVIILVVSATKQATSQKILSKITLLSSLSGREHQFMVPEPSFSLLNANCNGERVVFFLIEVVIISPPPTAFP